MSDEDLAPAPGGPPQIQGGGAPEQSEPLTAPEPNSGLSADVEQFVFVLKTKYPDRIKNRPRAFKNRVLRLIAVRLPPYPRSAGRPRQPRISRAAELYEQQLEEMRQGQRSDPNWLPIAQECVPQFHRFNSYRRQAEIQKLRNAVYGRLKRIKAKKLLRRSSHTRTPASE